MNAEIVDGERNAEGSELLQIVESGFHVLKDDILGGLEAQALGRPGS